MTPTEKTTKFERHLVEIAAIAKRIGEQLDLKADAQQACFATILIVPSGSFSKFWVFLQGGSSL